MEKSENNLPGHIGIIMDGNRRWAREKGMFPWDGHRKGFEVARDIALAANEMGLQHLSLFAWSTENWKRDAKEIEFIFDLFRNMFDKEFDILKQNNVRIRVVGDKSAFPEDMRQRMEKAEEDTKAATGLHLNVCMNYGGRVEILNGVKEALKNGMDPDDVTEESFSALLQTSNIPDADLIIRTSGEQRLSGFLTWLGVYSELLFIGKHWPDFTKTDLEEAILEFNNRQRRFGG